MAGAAIGVVGTVLLFNLQVSENRRSTQIDRLNSLLDVLADLEAAVQAWYTAHRLLEAGVSDTAHGDVGRAKSMQVTSIFRLRVMAAGLDGMSEMVDELATRCERMTARVDQGTQASYMNHRDEVARHLANAIRVTTDAPVSLADRLLGRFRGLRTDVVPHGASTGP